MPRPVNMLKSD